MEDFQKRVAQFIAENNLETDVPTRVLDLTSEVGELAKEVLKTTNYGEKNFQPDEAWAEELADALFSLSCLAISTHVDLDLALEVVLEKYAQRIQQTGDAGSGG